MSCHEGVSCDNCLKSNFTEKRYKCLICFDFDLCESCYEYEIETSHHLASHPMQCILSRRDFGRFYGGESITPESPPALVCPFCGSLGHTEMQLYEHVTKEHADAHTSVICPACAVMPSGDPNLVTDNLAQHLTIDHHLSQTNQDSNSSRARNCSRTRTTDRRKLTASQLTDMQTDREKQLRVLYRSENALRAVNNLTRLENRFTAGRRGGGVRTRSHRSTYSSNAGGASVIVQNNNAASSLSVRDSIDPIAELLSQLSGARRSAHEVGQAAGTASHLRELQAQLQMERQRASDIRQQLERLPSKLQGNSSTASNSTGTGTASKVQSTKKQTGPLKDEEDDPRFLLSKLDDVSLSASEKQEKEREDVERSHFVQELLLSMLSSDISSASNSRSNQLGAVTRTSPADQLLPSSFLSGAPQSANPSTTPKPSSITKKRTKSPRKKHASDQPQSGSANSPSNASTQHNSCSNGPTQSTPVLRPPTGIQPQNSPPQPRSYQNNVDKNSDEDDLQPQSPRQQSRGLRFQNRIYPPVRLSGVSSTAPLPRDVATSESVVKHIH